MRLWVVSSSYPASPEQSINAGVLARDLALSLADAGHELSVVTPAKPEPVRFDAALRGIVLPIRRPTHELANLSPRRPRDLASLVSLLVGARRTLKREARRSPPDAVVALWALPSGLFARWVRRWCGAPYAVWLLGSDVWKADRYPGGVAALRRILRDAAARFADGSELAARARDLTGIEVEFLPSARRLPRPTVAVPPCDLLFVGRYHPNKGPDVLLEAFSSVAARRAGTTLRMHGVGELRPELERRREALGLAASVEIAGPVSAEGLASALATTRLLVIPSRIESVPLILGDAVQAGRRVVASDVGDLGRLVTSHDLGVAVPPCEPAPLAEAILAELEAPPDETRAPPLAVLDPDRIAARIVASLSGRES
jgi:glycosyltransferase involved in cell wall biosynthesis